jgi:hypothetical protein
MTESSPTLQKVIDRLAIIGGPRPALSISLSTEIYYDLGIYGDVLYFDLLDWADKEFGTAFDHFDLGAYAPGEQPPFAFWRRRRRESDRKRGDTEASKFVILSRRSREKLGRPSASHLTRLQFLNRTPLVTSSHPLRASHSLTTSQSCEGKYVSSGKSRTAKIT